MSNTKVGKSREFHVKLETWRKRLLMKESREDPRTKVLEMVEEGLIDKDLLILMCLKFMSWDDVYEMCEKNDIDLNCLK